MPDVVVHVLRGSLGMIVLLALMWAMSTDRKRIN